VCVCVCVRACVCLGSGCDDQHFQCGGDDPECQSYLFVCDGRKDCRNGADEAFCGTSVSNSLLTYYFHDRLTVSLKAAEYTVSERDRKQPISTERRQG